jgi:hypothetical protein
MDTSSVNDPSGRAEGSYQQHQSQGSSQSSETHSMHVHHPGRESDVAGMTGGGGGSSSENFQVRVWCVREREWVLHQLLCGVLAAQGEGEAKISGDVIVEGMGVKGVGEICWV